MIAPIEHIVARASAAIEAALGEQYAGADPVVRPSQFADVQLNAALALAKRAGRQPREVAALIVEHLQVGDIASSVEISGPGFINVTFDDAYLGTAVSGQRADPRCGVELQTPLTIPVDYSAPNVAKEMHVGHLRTTVVGDAIVRTLEFLGHRVLRENHIGDWGTPFGMLIERLVVVGEDSAEASLLETDPNAFYQAAYAAFESDAGFADRSRARVVAMQAGDPETLRLWQRLYDRSKVYFNRIYGALDVTLTDDHLMGESFYNDALAQVCDDLQAAGVAVVSDGALCIFPPGFTGRDEKPLPLIIRKSDGGYGYATTDLATVRHRIDVSHADRMVYVVGATQAMHFQMVFAACRMAGWLPDEVEAVHVQIGSVLGDDRKLLKTRSGSSLRLMALLEEAVTAARGVIDERRPDMDEATRQSVARQIGIGAVKYADLSVAHDSDYVFDLDRMLALSGNTGPYMQYAAARIRSIFRNAGLDPDVQSAPIALGEEAERALALKLLDFGAVVARVGQDLAPHVLCAYLFELSQAFSTFYETCPVLKAEGAVREARLSLCALTLRVIVQGLELLGVGAPQEI